MRPITDSGRKSIRWRLVVDIGPKAPVWLPSQNIVYDPNSKNEYLIDHSESPSRHSIQALGQQIDDGLFQSPNAACPIDDYWKNVGQVYRWLSGGATSDEVLSTARPISIKMPKNSSEYISWLKFADQGCAPADLRLAVGSWALSAIAKFNEERADRFISLRIVNHLICLLGFDAPISAYQIWRREQLSWKWRMVIYPKICKAAVIRDAKIYFADISHVRYGENSLGDFNSNGKVRDTELSKVSYGFSMVSALSPSGDFRFTVHSGNINDQVIKLFLSSILRNSNNPIFLIVEDQSIYRNDRIKSFVKWHRGRLKIFFAPKKTSG